MRETETICARCLSRFIICLKDCLCKTNVFWIFLYHLKEFVVLRGKKNSDLNAIPPLCRLLWDSIIFATQNWRRKVLLLTTGLPKYTVSCCSDLKFELTWCFFEGALHTYSLQDQLKILLLNHLYAVKTMRLDSSVFSAYMVCLGVLVCLFLIPGDFFRACSNSDLVFV